MKKKPTDSPPVLFLVFNRPDLTSRTLSAIRKAQPKQLFIAADGPREEVPGEDELCGRTREAASQVDWECEVKTLFREENLGCELAVSQAITWFLKQVDSGIILEDDCVPDVSFFNYCGELLSRYASAQDVMAITGNNFQDGRSATNSDYYFSKYLHCWGWATWSRAWARYDHDLSGSSIESVAAKYSAGAAEKAYWADKFKRVKANTINTWATRWLYSIWLHEGLVATPNVNLVSNIGFDERATHTSTGDSVPSRSLHVHTHPKTVGRNHEADLYVAKSHYGIYFPTLAQRIRFLIGDIRRALTRLFR
ncbi:MAG: hypothetical protein NXI04_18800 [Planctomycetaceae bacterium]|nr:hypothetical protein [Planctomycetaceae bacterium]